MPLKCQLNFSLLISIKVNVIYAKNDGGRYGFEATSRADEVYVVGYECILRLKQKQTKKDFSIIVIEDHV